MIIAALIIGYLLTGILMAALFLAVTTESSDPHTKAMVTIVIWPLCTVIVILSAMAEIAVGIAERLKRQGNKR